MDKLPEIIGVAGTNGAGKDTLADVRVERQLARKVSLSDILRDMADERGLSHERHHLRTISMELSSKLGAGALSTMTIHHFHKTRADHENGLSIVSIRRPDEAHAIQSVGGALIWIDAPREIRHKRIEAGKRNRVDDLVTFEEFCEQEDKEMHPESDDPFALNMAGVRDIADMHLLNDFDSKAAFKKSLIDRFHL